MSLYLGDKPIANDGLQRLTGEIGDIGIAPFGIDESLNLRRYLNGQVISQTQFEAFTNKVKSAIALHPNLAATEENWQAEVTASVLGQCGKFVVDDEAGTIRLPAVVNAQGLLGLTGIGNLVNESLPNITGVGGIIDNTNVPLSGAFKSEGLSNDFGLSPLTGRTCTTQTLDASRSSTAYQTDAPVQQEAIQYPYYIQVATGIEETLPAIREYGINTPFFFGWSMYSENAPYNASWLASNGQYNASTLYPDLWTQLTGVELNDSLVKGDTIEINGKAYVKRGLPVVLSTGTITDYDWVVNTSDSTFRLPLLNGERVLVAKKEATTEDPTWYNLYSDGWLEQGGQINQNVAEWTQVSLMIPYKNKLYRVLATQQFSTNTYFKDAALGIHTIDQATFKISCYSQAAQMNWRANGYTNIPTTSDFTEVKGLYYYVGDVVQDASLINAGAVLSDVVDLKQTTLRTNQITNCITEIPQDIKLELNDGTLTLKAGSKVYVPNGFEEDGTTLKFDVVTIESDIVAYQGGVDRATTLSYNKSSNTLERHTTSTMLFSGDTAPTTNQYALWYDTLNNIIKKTIDKGVTWIETEGISFPIAQVMEISGSGYSSIDQVFNGFGYIGSTVFALPGVKGLIPNGRNADGSLRNIEVTTSAVRTISWPNYTHQIIAITSTGSIDIYSGFYYSERENTHFRSSDGTEALIVDCGRATCKSSVITFFDVKTPFQAVGRNNSSWVSAQAMPSNRYIDLTLLTSGSTYTAPANGWFFVVQGNNGNGYLNLYDVGTTGFGQMLYIESGFAGKVVLPVKKGDVVTYGYVGRNANDTVNTFRFIYAEGENV